MNGGMKEEHLGTALQGVISLDNNQVPTQPAFTINPVMLPPFTWWLLIFAPN